MQNDDGKRLFGIIGFVVFLALLNAASYYFGLGFTVF